MTDLIDTTDIFNLASQEMPDPARLLAEKIAREAAAKHLSDIQLPLFPTATTPDQSQDLHPHP